MQIEEREIKILGETDRWLALHKPSGISVHNNKGRDLISYLRSARGLTRVYPVNRLDQGVNGIVLFAKSHESAQFLNRAFEERRVAKMYRARSRVFRGPIPKVGDHGLWKWPLSKRAEGRKDPKGFGGIRVPCKTKWQVNETDGIELSLQIEPITGRKHQIRRHAAIAGWPIIGDGRYGPQGMGTTPFEPIFLTACQLTFPDPDAGEVTVTTDTTK